MSWKKLTPFKMDQRINSREKLLFFAVILVSCFVFLKSCIMASQDAISQTRQEISKLEEEREQLQTELSVISARPRVVAEEHSFISSAAEIERSLSAIAQPLNTQGVRIIKTDFSEVQNNIQEVKAADKKEGNQPAAAAVAPPQSDLFIQRNASFAISGSFESVGRYIDYLEQLPAPFVINHFSFNADENVLGKVQAQIQGGFYALR